MNLLTLIWGIIYLILFLILLVCMFLESASNRVTLIPRWTLSLNALLQAGSLGNGTSFSGNGDIDLIVYINGLNSIDDLINHRQELLESLKTCVQSYGPWQGHLQIKDVTKFAVRCTMNGSKIDLLPAYNLLKSQ